jgi:putative transcriptional regulator
MARRERCSNCGAEARVTHGDYEFKESGLPVLLKGIELIKCGKCGSVDPVIPKPAQIMRTLALAVISQPYRLTGAEVRFLRKHLGKTAEEFAKFLHVDKTVLSRWETGTHPVGEQSDRLIRLIVAGLAEGLKKHDIEVTIEKLPEIQSESRDVGIRVDPETMSYDYVA